MYGELVIAYLFLAGIGAGGVVAASLADLLLVREPFGAAAAPYESKAPAERLVALVFAASLGAVGLAMACLMLDVGRPDRVLALFLAPRPALMTLGAWALAVLGALLAALTLARFLYVPWVSRRAVAVLEAAAVPVACVVAVYVGLLLQANVGVRLWSTPWMTVLFALSAASCGCATVLAAALFVPDDARVAQLTAAAVRADGVVIALEALAAGLFLAFALGSDHPGVAASAEALLHGPAALPWWVGFGACGVVLPATVELAWLVGRGRGGAVRAGTDDGRAAVPDRARATCALACAAALVFAGAAGLRAAMVEAGEQRPLELQSVEPLRLPDDAAAGPRPESGAGSPTSAETQKENERNASTWLS